MFKPILIKIIYLKRCDNSFKKKEEDENA